VVLHLMGAKSGGTGARQVTRLPDGRVQRRRALFAMQHNGWDHGLRVTDEGTGLVGHGGGILLRKLADQCGLTSALEAALARAGKSPQLSRGVVFVSMAIAITLGATSMSGIAVLAQLGPVLSAAPSGSTVRRALGLADARTLERIARARARAYRRLLARLLPAGRSRSASSVGVY
jgi:hypothetical protein